MFKRFALGPKRGGLKYQITISVECLDLAVLRCGKARPQYALGMKRSREKKSHTEERISERHKI